MNNCSRSPHQRVGSKAASGYITVCASALFPFRASYFFSSCIFQKEALVYLRTI